MLKAYQTLFFGEFKDRFTPTLKPFSLFDRHDLAFVLLRGLECLREDKRAECFVVIPFSRRILFNTACFFFSTAALSRITKSMPMTSKPWTFLFFLINGQISPFSHWTSS